MGNKALDCTALTVSLIGAINWGLVGFFNFNLVSWIFGNAHPQPQVCVGRAKQHCQEYTQDYGYPSHLRNHLICRYKWFKTIFIFHVTITPLYIISPYYNTAGK